MTRKMMKTNARDSLRGNWGIAILTLLIGYVLTAAASCVFGVGELIVIGPIETGLGLIFMKLSYHDNAEVGDLFVPFQNFANTFFAGFLVTIFTFLWTLLLVVPGIVKGIAYSQTFFIMNEHPDFTGKEAIQPGDDARIQVGVLCVEPELYRVVPAVYHYIWTDAVLCPALLPGYHGGVLPLSEGKSGTESGSSGVLRVFSQWNN